MAGWSSLAICNVGKASLIRSVLTSSRNGLSAKSLNYVPVRNSGHGRSFLVTLSQFRFMRLRDIAHFYFVLGAIPFTAVVLYCNIFIGPAKLTKIPENYVPKHWEYYEHPITRWFARLLPSPQESYEKELHRVYAESQFYELRKLENKVEKLMKEKENYQAWYYLNSGAKYTRKAAEIGRELKKSEGKLFGSVI